MCGRSMMVRGPSFGAYRKRHRADFFGLDVERLGARAKVGVGLAVLAPVVLSGVLLVVLVPNLWWIFTTYFWIAFPALGLLGSGLAGVGAERSERVERAAAMDPERDLLVALLSHGEMTAAGIAAETGLSVDEADRRLKDLAEAGHLEMRVRGGGIFYALWGVRPDDTGRPVGGTMYRLIVAARIRGIFTRINAGDYEAMVRSLAPRFTYTFYGDHALGGERTTHAAMRAWWERVFRLLPGLRFEPRDVLVAGWPWATRVATDVAVHVTLPDGTRYENVVNQFVKLRWGRVTEVRTLEDTQKLARALERLAAGGYSEAVAAPITDASVADARSRQKEAL